MKPTTTWILIADGGRARLFANHGPGKGIEPLDATFKADHRSTHEIVGDRLGRTYESKGDARHAIAAQTDPHRELKRKFAEHLAEVLDQQKKAHAFDRLIIVAPPVVLGDLRDALTAPVRGVIHGELHKDLTKTPYAELPDHLAAVMPV
jgi:protein required for attachment to host cells